MPRPAESGNPAAGVNGGSRLVEGRGHPGQLGLPAPLKWPEVVEMELDPPPADWSAYQGAPSQRMGQGAAIDELQLPSQGNAVGDA